MRVILVALLLVAVTPMTPAQAQAIPIDMSGYAFHPAMLTITVGETVTWTNHDQAPHDVTTTSAPVALHSSTLAKGALWSYTFTTPGTYRYICSIHPDMTATLVVRPAPTPVAAPTVRTIRHAIAAHVASTPTHATHTPTHAARTPTAQTASASAAVAATTPAPKLRPLLLVAGLVVAIATFCLLLLASRPEDATARH